MTAQLQPGYARDTDPATSHAAARYPHASARARLLLTFAEHEAHGLTVYEAARILGTEKGTTDRRRAELLERLQIIDSNQTRPTNTGASAIVFVVSDVLNTFVAGQIVKS